MEKVDSYAESTGVSKKVACDEFNLPNSNYSRWNKKRPALMEAAENPKKRSSRSLGTGPKIKYPALEEEMHKLYLRRRILGYKVSIPKSNDSLLMHMKQYVCQ